MGAAGGGKMKKAASVGTTPSISFDAGIHSPEVADGDRQTDGRVHTPLMQAQAHLLSVSPAGCSDRAMTTSFSLHGP